MPDTKQKLTISILIPAHNEEKMIAACLDSCLRQTRRLDQIIVVNDGSTDATASILETYGRAITVITIPKATGNKSRAQEIGINAVTTDIIIATDGDTILHEKFAEEIEKDFVSNPELSVVAGYVQSTKYNILTAIREIDYTISQDIFKRAQEYVQFLLVIPGCAGAFKAELFRDGTIQFDHDTLTEDLDFTYKLNAKDKLIKINYNAIVYTQDPPTLHSYINQTRRWYGGGWQNLKKHFPVIISKPGASLILSLAYLDGTVFNSAFFFLLFINTRLFLELMLLYCIVGTCMGIYAGIRKHRFDLVLVGPLIPLSTLLNAYILMEQLIIEVILRRKNMTWFHPERKPVAIEETNLAKI
jgi:cellulose synthase/poly-beta-1,6-N-acetylglucosamine synthase-like glycosyltransferase